MYPGLNLILFLGLCLLLFRLRRSGWKLSRQILAGLLAGVVFGLGLQWAYGAQSAVVTATLEWTGVVAAGYINLLRMIIMPLVLVMMIAAVLKLREVADLGRIGGAVVGLLIGTTMIAALVGILVTSAFGLTADSITQGARELASAEALSQRYETVAGLSLPEVLIRFVPANIFHDLTEARPTSIIAVVLFGILFGIAALGVARESPARGAQIEAFVETTRLIVMRLVHLVMALTPYGILALIGGVVASSDAGDIVTLLSFVVASYLAIAIMFAVHAALLFLHGVGLSTYFQAVWPVLAFAFTSRSSAATIPLNVETQIDSLRVATPIANLSATLGATIGQNGCAGIYPAMLAVMIAPSMGLDPLALDFMAGLIGVIAISSFGVAGVGGGATFAALIVLPAMGFPVTVAAVLISIEPLIDMARTALNVNGSMTAGVVTQRWLGESIAR
ncbi:cation:dicarboxylase symporter family transporter [Haliea sp. E1-2-M8]|uniref:cation:dicarboxylate symporter family transporter n=1 Tax=Haliea sp. E1-2-M8 TaxID=3064706 RepID=UPI002715D0E8|nr:cation:dicarboxylase symporter family transporter [Haliea sp. E1-2-M8]MDO8861869.1 cation:dicarboxylase symporter family transporter [Haliea sp. E1-2-M8]